MSTVPFLTFPELPQTFYIKKDESKKFLSRSRGYRERPDFPLHCFAVCM